MALTGFLSLSGLMPDDNPDRKETLSGKLSINQILKEYYEN